MGWEWVAREQRLKGEAGWACDLGRECPDQQSGQGPRAGEPAAPAEHGGATGRRLLQAVLGTLVLLGGRWRAVAGLEQKSLEI